MRALAAVEGKNIQDADALLDSALAREQAYWDACADAAGLAGLRGRPVRQAAALATLAGEIPSLDEAIGVRHRI